MKLENRSALVTGGAVRMGRALALGLAANGVHIALHYNSSPEQAEQTCQDIRALGVRAVALQANLAMPDTPASLFARSLEAMGEIDFLVNNAASFHPGGWRDTTLTQWDQTFALNLRAPFFLAQAFGRALGERCGHIVNIADWRAVRPGVGHMAYTYAKAGLVAMTRSLAQAMAPNVQVNAIAPGAVLPPPGADESYLDKVAEMVPLKRHGSPDDIAEALLYLLRSDFVSGELLFVTGGQEL